MGRWCCSVGGVPSGWEVQVVRYVCGRVGVNSWGFAGKFVGKMAIFDSRVGRVGGEGADAFRLQLIS